LTPDGFEKVAEVSEVPAGSVKVVKAGGIDVMLANVDGMFYALPNRCTHAGGPLGRGKLKENVVQCPLHGSRFDVRTGAIVNGPARVPEVPLPVKVEGSSIWVGKSAHTP
jgi:3-phenylpropionate/trans-cinnamate dioxygenase ferredoxin subunit